MDAATRMFFESRFGHDFSHVRVHSDAKAAVSARAVNAWAYTVAPTSCSLVVSTPLGRQSGIAYSRMNSRTSCSRVCSAH